MARARSVISDAALRQLQVTRAGLERRWISLTSLLDSTLELSAQQLRLEVEYQDGGVWVGLVGTACERVDRNEGGSTFVAPLCALPFELRAWLGFREVWDRGERSETFTFRELGLTVFFGYEGDPVKRQVFRAEWPGIRAWRGTELGFQSPGAGHPHWQFDVLQTLREATITEDRLIALEKEERVEDFSEAEQGRDLDDSFRSIRLERMHFASAAPWWISDRENARPHTNAPPDEPGLRRWLVACLAYVRQELRRCGSAL